MSKKKTQAASKTETPGFALQRINYILIIAGIILIGIGFILMIGGGAQRPDEFSEAIFDTQRLTVAPLLVLLGYAVEIIAIMYKPAVKEAAGTEAPGQ